MKAVVINHPGGPEVLQIKERETPEVGKNEVLIRVAAAGVNRPDIAQRKGNYPAPADAVQDILGLEVAGEIVAKGANVSSWDIGEKVIALVKGGGYAEYVAADEGSCLPIPKGFSVVDAAALPEVLFTVWHNVFQRGQLKPSEHILIYGGSGGIGSMAIQLATIYGAHVTTLASSQQKADYCRSLGAEKVVNYKEENLFETLGEASQHLILDSIGGDYLDSNLHLLKEDGRLVYINAMEGPKAPLNIILLMRKRLTITGSTMRPRSYEFKKQVAEDILKNAYPLIENPSFKNLVKYRFPLEEAKEAHSLMDSRDFVGKIILTTGI